MMDKPYIQSVLRELQNMGYQGDEAKEVLISHYKGVRRTWGFNPSAKDFAKVIDEIQQAVIRKYDPNNPEHIYIGHLRDKVKARKKLDLKCPLGMTCDSAETNIKKVKAKVDVSMQM
jgi:hypothetical protein